MVERKQPQVAPPRRYTGESDGRRWPWLRWFILVALLVAVAGHWFYHYAPRERAASVEPGTLPQAMLADGRFEVIAWIPYPHQNLAAAFDDPSSLLRDAVIASGREAPRMPSFGPFFLPPSKELMLGLDLEGGRFQVAARIYPGLALFARLAGRLASNPWLEGGAVVLDGQPATVRWQDGLWIVASDAQPSSEEAVPLDRSQTAALQRPLHGALRLRQPAGLMPAGLYPLERPDGAQETLLLRRAGVDKVELPPQRRPETLWRPYQALLVVQSLQSPGVDASQDAAAFLLLRDTPSAVTGSAPGATPDPAASMSGDKRGFALLQARPGRDLSIGVLGASFLLGQAGYSGAASGWRVDANSEANFLRGTLLVPPLQTLLGSSDGPRVRFALIVDPAATDPIFADLEQGIDRLHLGRLPEAARVRALRRLIRHFNKAGRLRVTVTEPADFELVVEPRSPGATG